MRVTVRDRAGEQVAWLNGTNRAGMNRVVWNLRHSEPDQDRRGPSGPLVIPGDYTVQVTAGGASSATMSLDVQEDPRIDVDPATRAEWTTTLLELSTLARDAAALAQRTSDMVEALDEDPSGVDAAVLAKARDLRRETSELRSRTGRLRFSVEGWVALPSADQSSQHRFLSEMLATLSGEVDDLEGRIGG